MSIAAAGTCVMAAFRPPTLQGALLHVWMLVCMAGIDFCVVSFFKWLHVKICSMLYLTFCPLSSFSFCFFDSPGDWELWSQG